MYSALPLRIRVECGELNWRLRGITVGIVALAAAMIPFLQLPPIEVERLDVYIDVAVVAATALVSMLSGPLAGLAYASYYASASSPATIILAFAAAAFFRRKESVVEKLLDLIRAGSLPRPTGLAAAAIMAAFSSSQALPEGATLLYAGIAASLAPSTVEALIMGLLGGLHPAVSASLGAYVASSPRCYRCENGMQLSGLRLVGIYTRSKGFTCASGDPVIALTYNSLILVLGGYGIELARMLSQEIKAELMIAVDEEEYKEALRSASEKKAPVVVASTHLPENLLPPAPGRDTAVIVSGVKDPVYLDRLAKTLGIDKRTLEIFAGKPGLALAFPGCHDEVLLMEVTAR